MKRAESEDTETYRERRAKKNKALKDYLRGKVIWHSQIQGTYRREAGPIGSDAE